jgi:FMN phosphatase YigB (HAD superfamily)
VRDLVFMIDLDNTILDNDGVKKDLKARLLEDLGAEMSARFWELYEIIRKEIDIIDFIEGFRRLREEFPERAATIDAARDTMMDWDFRPRLYPNALETVLHLKGLGMPIVVSDGDAVFQPSKIHECGVTELVDGRVFIFVHKEKHLPAVETRFKAGHFVLIDDKPGILMRSKAALGSKLTTVHVLQGKYATDPKYAVEYSPDIVVESFSDLRRYGAEDFLKG